MDIRDIKENVEYPGILAFADMFALQQLLVDHYTSIEKLPKAPIDINTKNGQDLVKDFSGRIIEELGEGFESYLLMLDMFHHGIEEEEMIPHLQNFNEEIADALHFWLELMIFSGYGIITLENWLKEYIDKRFLKGHDPLKIWFDLGEYMVMDEIANKKVPCRWVIKDHMLKDEFLRGGRQLGKARRDILKQLLWDFTYHIQIARNTLKNKPWKQTQMMTDVNQYEESQRNATVALFKFLYFAGFTKESLYVIYYKKNKVNQFRIKSKY
jgi:hypothetical protein